MPTKKTYPCIECKKAVDNNGSISCAACNRWMHKDCADPTVYKLVIEMFNKYGTHFWSCEGCTLGLMNLQKMVLAQETQIKELRKDMEAAKIDINQNQEDISIVNDRIEKVEKTCVELKENPTNDILKELDERASKENNIIIHGVKEQDQDLTPLERKREDEKIVKEIIEACKVKINIRDDCKFIVRIGERKELKNRPICICFRKLEVRKKIMENTRDLAMDFPNINITPDLTKKQVEMDRDLKKEAERLNKDLKPEEAKNYIWKPVGAYGQRRLAKLKKKPETIDVQETQTNGNLEAEEESHQNTRPRRRMY